MDKETIIRGCEYWVNNHKDENLLLTYSSVVELLDILKEQDIVEPIYIENPYIHLPVNYCPKCREPISKFITGNPYKETKYCYYYGQAVKWE